MTVETTGIAPPAVSGYLDYLPAVLRGDPRLGRFLLAFRAVLTGSGTLHGVEPVEGLESLIARTPDLVDPATTDEEFLPWLAGWVALTLRADWDVETKRGFLQQVVPLYGQRGTLSGLRRMLAIYLRSGVDDVLIEDGFDEVPHYFQVRLTLGGVPAAQLRRTQEIARAIIDQEKPAHTFYGLKFVVPTMRLVSESLRETEGGVPDLLILGTNTTLGTSDSPAGTKES